MPDGKQGGGKRGEVRWKMEHRPHSLNVSWFIIIRSEIPGRISETVARYLPYMLSMKRV